MTHPTAAKTARDPAAGERGRRLILVNTEAPEEHRVALVEAGRLEAFDVETPAQVQLRGNIYKGRIANVEPSLRAAFVEMGLERHGYLPFQDIHPDYLGNPENGRPVHELLSRGQEVLVQVVKEPTHLKGAAVTTYLSIPGRFLVLMPGTAHVGVSRRIEDEAERRRLKEILAGAALPEGTGLIARTASAGVPKREILKDGKYLLRLWRAIRQKAQKAKVPALVHRERDLITRFLRDHLDADVQEILVDQRATFDAVRGFLRVIAPRQARAVRLYQESEPLFSRFHLEHQIEQIYQPRVELPSGGFLVIEPTEALVAVDVNSGRNVQGKDLEETALVTNLEAADEAARQLRLRDLGGLVVIDFIDMKGRANRARVERRLREGLRKDRARTDVGRISRFGLLEMVRQKIRAPLELGTYRPCPTCRGRGLVRSVETLALVYLRRIRSRLAGMKPGEVTRVALEVPGAVAGYLLNRKRAELLRLEEAFGVQVEVTGSAALGPEEHRLELR
ncbi:Rne/Rng family ribonuclease [Dissulfurirhabdus thermomarina]|uniref:Ribonuclease G n=1 Tax=Dissulfurirhabdus thermomarina TaxID=1765737 RepID=A0A6N9TQ83_DISTH|nr:Rne/Rng family ribonuclease [Dissulfurirhabdus thermomarina]NDY43432.1 Rne/Rng family ribonuclease [Dissulfurirhabdus thermomarina]NMX23525.1 Rne/Rng family ribonuclease [Dissulfurirhabdus thermomarina]